MKRLPKEFKPLWMLLTLAAFMTFYAYIQMFSIITQP